jgi:hypothetical protein
MALNDKLRYQEEKAIWDRLNSEAPQLSTLSAPTRRGRLHVRTPPPGDIADKMPPPGHDSYEPPLIVIAPRPLVVHSVAGRHGRLHARTPPPPDLSSEMPPILALSAAPAAATTAPAPTPCATAQVPPLVAPASTFAHLLSLAPAKDTPPKQADLRTKLLTIA